QEALIAHLRRRASRSRRPLFLMSRSSAILDLAAVGSDEAIIFCPANHSPPTPVTPHIGGPGYEAVATFLASPEVRKRAQRAPIRRSFLSAAPSFLSAILLGVAILVSPIQAVAQTTINFWHYQTSNRGVLTQTIREFEAANPDIKVRELFKDLTNIAT